MSEVSRAEKLLILIGTVLACIYLHTIADAYLTKALGIVYELFKYGLI